MPVPTTPAVGSEFSEWDVVADDVVIRDEQVVPERADRFGLAAASSQLCEVGGEVCAFGS
jgi:hypothetical protein